MSELYIYQNAGCSDKNRMQYSQLTIFCNKSRYPQLLRHHSHTCSTLLYAHFVIKSPVPLNWNPQPMANRGPYVFLWRITVSSYIQGLWQIGKMFGTFLQRVFAISEQPVLCPQSVHNSRLHSFPQCINSHLSNALTCSCYEFGAMALRLMMLEGPTHAKGPHTRQRAPHTLATTRLQHQSYT